MTRRRPNNGNSLTIVSARSFYARQQKAESENVTLNCDRPLSTEDYVYFTKIFDFSKYQEEDRETYRSLYFDNIRKGVKGNKRKELELICRVLLTQINTD